MTQLEKALICGAIVAVWLAFLCGYAYYPRWSLKNDTSRQNPEAIWVPVVLTLFGLLALIS